MRPEAATCTDDTFVRAGVLMLAQASVAWSIGADP
jgi:hypothetical protein